MPVTIGLLFGAGVARGQQPAATAQVYAVVENMPRFLKADSTAETMMAYLARSTRYPPEALRAQATGRVYVSFVVNPDGLVEQVKILKGQHKALNAEALRVVGAMPRWELPGRQHGQPVSVAFTVPISFNMRNAGPVESKEIMAAQLRYASAVRKQLDEARAQLAQSKPSDGETGPLFTADPLGAAHYISRQQQYPFDALQARQQGTVLVAFVVTADGTVAEARVMRGLFPSLDAEALRIVRGMPRWQPGTQHGQPVAMPLTEIPVTFQIK